MTQAAYVAFGHGLDVALSAAGAMMLVCGFVAAITMRRARARAQPSDPGAPRATEPRDLDGDLRTPVPRCRRQPGATATLGNRVARTRREPSGTYRLEDVWLS